MPDVEDVVDRIMEVVAMGTVCGVGIRARVTAIMEGEQAEKDHAVESAKHRERWLIRQEARDE